MPKLPPDQQTAILEGHVGKIDKAMQTLVRDSKRMADVLDADAQVKLAAYMHARVNDMIADLGKAKRSVFSLSAPPIPVNEIVLAPNLVIPADMIINGSIVATTVMPPMRPVPQPAADEDDELAAIAELDDDTKPPPPRTAAAMIAAEPEPVNDPLKPPPPGKWRKPTGRLVGTKEPVWVETDAPKKEKEEETEKPDHTGFIQEAGFLEAE